MAISRAAIWKRKYPRQLAEVLTAIDDVSTMQKFLRDVMTENEIDEISSRLQAAQMLVAGSSYATVIAATKLSSRTVARISDWLQNGYKGYDAAFQIIEKTK
jgi:TrpR-related protein YerC/YecD